MSRDEGLGSYGFALVAHILERDFECCGRGPGFLRRLRIHRGSFFWRLRSGLVGGVSHHKALNRYGYRPQMECRQAGSGVGKFGILCRVIGPYKGISPVRSLAAVSKPCMTPHSTGFSPFRRDCIF